MKMSLTSTIAAKSSTLVETISGGVQSTTQELSTGEDVTKLGRDSNNVALTYPLNLGAESGHPNFFIFRAYDLAHTTKQHYTDMRSSFTAAQTENEQSGEVPSELKATLALYAPNIVEEVSHEYDKTPTSVLNDFLASAASAAGSDTVSEGVDRGKRAVATAAGATLAQIKRSFIQSNAAGQLEKNSSVVTDNVTVTAYKGTAQRTQTMVYQFHPKSLDELKVVAEIIKTFYGLSLPVKGQIDSQLLDTGTANLGSGFAAGFAKYATLLKTPPVWMIEEVSDTDATRYTPRFIFGPAGITSVKLNRTPDQYWRTFRGTAGDPAGIELEITFSELIPLDRAMYQRDLNSNVRGYDSGTQTASGSNTNSGSFFGDIEGLIK
ncbi:baseplate tail tube cap [Vibrio phage ValKK3]|uniref:Baseplate tail tube cap n=1 Tax=Vibrio phage ValKK3 TaxID=1610855 RepID=A0A0D4DC58_9CAUD|nr:baseplate tail tube cap [Vibrio phage ValKK3]AJT61153.1 baseplate tail tube cap [Vibrio phage ValKK3]